MLSASDGFRQNPDGLGGIAGGIAINFKTDIRADDAPPWLTILIVGHIIAPLMLTFETYKSMPFWQEMTGMIALALLLIFLILPRAKGFFLALLWAQKGKKAA